MSIDGDLRSIFRRSLPTVDWQSIESAITGGGVPDVNGCHRGAEFWVEFKQTEEWAVSLRPEQVGWLCRRARAGGRVFIAVRRRCLAGPRRAGADELWLLWGHFAPDLKTGGLRRAPPGSVLGIWSGGPRSWDWGAVLACLTSGESLRSLRQTSSPR